MDTQQNPTTSAHRIRARGPATPYLRVVVTAQCPLGCSYCHMEGDPPVDGVAGGLPPATLLSLVHAGLDNGVRKIKLLGGEPLLRRDLPQLVGSVAERDPTIDISVITGGAVAAERLDGLFSAGLTRANMTIHGWSLGVFHARTKRGPRVWELRNRFLERLIEHGRPIKLNFVYTGRSDHQDLQSLLDWAASRPVVVNVLDDLSNPALDHKRLFEVLTELRGKPARVREEPDPHSLPTTRLHWFDGLEVEVKHCRLGDLAPWSACSSCSLRGNCREGIDALRLSHTGVLRPCMDRPDLGLPLVPILRKGGPEAVADVWRDFLKQNRRWAP